MYKSLEMELKIKLIGTLGKDDDGDLWFEIEDYESEDIDNKILENIILNNYNDLCLAVVRKFKKEMEVE